MQVVSDGYVTSDSGTGIVHQAPAFGEDDYRVCIANGIIGKDADLPCPVDANGIFTEEVCKVHLALLQQTCVLLPTTLQ